MLVLKSGVKLPRDEFHFQFTRSGGPGGQNVNKVSSKAQLHWVPKDSPKLPEGVRDRFLAKFGHRLSKEGAIVIMSQVSRDQGKNQANCLDKLRKMIESVWEPPKKRRVTKPSRTSNEKRLKAKKAVSGRKVMRRLPPGD